MTGHNTIPFNPLDKRNLGVSVAQAMLEQPVQKLSNLEFFLGVGIYAIYYTGSFDAYAPLAKHNKNGHFEIPIYVGKAVPSGARKGGEIGDATNSRALYRRLKEHAESIASASNLDSEDFYCRYLVVDDIWIPLGESLLITKFTPLWNKVIDGFGNHDPGAGRHKGLRPRWDVVHPGRAWAGKCAQRPETQEDIILDVVNFFATIPTPIT